MAFLQELCRNYYKLIKESWNISIGILTNKIRCPQPFHGNCFKLAGGSFGHFDKNYYELLKGSLTFSWELFQIR